MMWKLLGVPLAAYNAIESVVDSCRDPVWPKLGSVLYCDLISGSMEHSGIYVGNNKIAHLSGRGKIEEVSPRKFIEGTTAINIYVSCRDLSSVGSEAVVRRARKAVGQTRNYNFLFDNCHQFSAGCLTGDFENSSNFLTMLKDESSKVLGSNTWRHWDKNCPSLLEPF